MTSTGAPSAVAPAHLRYIKLGPGGAWFERCREEGIIEFGRRSVPHELAATKDWAAIERWLAADGCTPGKAKDFTREIADFYGLGADALWITIEAGRLWWAFAEPEVTPINAGPDRGARFRKVIGCWRDTDLTGRLLTLDTLSTRLTKVAAYRQTLCKVGAASYLIRRINGVEEPIVVEALAAQARVIQSARALIEQLDWRDFELLVDLIFANGGWRRASGVGGSDQADSDLVLEQPVSGERAFVQVKSRASAAVLADYVERFRAAASFDKLFFVCHSPSAALVSPAPDVHVWLGDRLAEQAVRAGLFSWLTEKAR